MANKREACVDSNVHPKKTAPVVEERYLEGLLHCLGCAHDHISDDPRCNDCVCGSLFEASKPALSGVEHSRQVNVTSLDPGDVLCVKRGGVVHEVWENKVNELEDVHVDVRLIDPSMCPIDHGTITGWCARCGKRAI